MKKLLLGCTIALCLTPLLHAGDVSAPTPLAPSSASSFEEWRDGKYLSGNWGGLRDQLYDQGIEPFIYWNAIFAGNPSGGLRHDFNFACDTFFGVNMDLEKLAGLNGLHFTLSGINRSGSDLQRDTGSIYSPMQLVGGQATFLYNVTLEQYFFDKTLSFKIGRFSGSDDFNTSPLYSYYLNNGIDGNIRNVLFDTQFSAYPFATWAARVKYTPNENWTAQLGIFQTQSDVFEPRHNGTDFNIQGEDGVILMAQVGWSPELFKRPVETPPDAKSIVNDKDGPDGKATPPPITMKGLPGHYWLGATFSPWHGYTQFNDPHKTGNSYGFYAHADQMVYREKDTEDQGLTVFLATGYYPQDNISVIPFQLNSGAIYKGLLPSRGEDRLIGGFIYGNYGYQFQVAQRAAGNGNPTREMVGELGYRIQLTKFAYLQPDVQYIIRPGGTGRTQDALVLGTQMGVTF